MKRGIGGTSGAKRAKHQDAHPRLGKYEIAHRAPRVVEDPQQQQQEQQQQGDEEGVRVDKTELRVQIVDFVAQRGEMEHVALWNVKTVVQSVFEGRNGGGAPMYRGMFLARRLRADEPPMRWMPDARRLRADDDERRRYVLLRGVLPVCSPLAVVRVWCTPLAMPVLRSGCVVLPDDATGPGWYGGADGGVQSTLQLEQPGALFAKRARKTKKPPSRKDVEDTVAKLKGVGRGGGKKWRDKDESFAVRLLGSRVRQSYEERSGLQLAAKACSWDVEAVPMPHTMPVFSVCTGTNYTPPLLDSAFRGCTTSCAAAVQLRKVYFFRVMSALEELVSKDKRPYWSDFVEDMVERGHSEHSGRHRMASELEPQPIYVPQDLLYAALGARHLLDLSEALHVLHERVWDDVQRNLGKVGSPVQRAAQAAEVMRRVRLFCASAQTAAFDTQRRLQTLLLGSGVVGGTSAEVRLFVEPLLGAAGEHLEPLVQCADTARFVQVSDATRPLLPWGPVYAFDRDHPASRAVMLCLQCLFQQPQPDRPLPNSEGDVFPPRTLKDLADTVRKKVPASAGLPPHEWAAAGLCALRRAGVVCLRAVTRAADEWCAAGNDAHEDAVAAALQEGNQGIVVLSRTRAMLEDDVLVLLEELRCRFCRVTPRINVPRAVRDWHNGGREVQLTPEQHKAAERALSHPLGMITGAAGCGKTLVSMAMRNALDAAHVLDLAFLGKVSVDTAMKRRRWIRAPEKDSAAAPTDGGESERQLTFTGDMFIMLSRMKYAADTFKDIEVLIIEEASTMSLQLFGRLMRTALGVCPRLSRVILVGDPEQLMPVGGAPMLHVLVRALPHCVSELRENHRQKTCPLLARAVGMLRDGRLIECKRQNRDLCLLEPVSPVPRDETRWQLQRFANFFKTCADPFTCHAIQFAGCALSMMHQHQWTPENTLFIADRNEDCRKINRFVMNYYRMPQDMARLRLGTHIMFKRNDGERIRNGMIAQIIAVEHESAAFAKYTLVPIDLIGKYNENKNSEVVLSQSIQVDSTYLRTFGATFGFCVTSYCSIGNEREHIMYYVSNGARCVTRAHVYTATTRATKFLAVFANHDNLHKCLAHPATLSPSPFAFHAARKFHNM